MFSPFSLPGFVFVPITATSARKVPVGWSAFCLNGWACVARFLGKRHVIEDEKGSFFCLQIVGLSALNRLAITLALRRHSFQISRQKDWVSGSQTP